MSKTLVEKYVEDPIHMRLFQQERAIYEVTELIESLMEATGVSRAELAKRLGKTKGWVTQLLDGEANKTIRTVADTFAVLGHEYRSFHRPIQIGKRINSAASTDELSAEGACGAPAAPVRSIIKIHEPDGLRRETRSSSVTFPETAVAEVAQ
jgi:transcriptional regulator with XRE-family HTH domain